MSWSLYLPWHWRNQLELAVAEVGLLWPLCLVWLEEAALAPFVDDLKASARASRFLVSLAMSSRDAVPWTEAEEVVVSQSTFCGAWPLSAFEFSHSRRNIVARRAVTPTDDSCCMNSLVVSMTASMGPISRQRSATRDVFSLAAL